MFISGRFVSITGNSNHAAIAIVLFTPPFLLNINNNSKKLLNFLILLLLVSLLFLTGSRTGLLTFSFFLFFFYPNKNKFILFSFSIVFAYFLVTKLFLNKVDFDYASVFDRVQTNSTNRNQNWTEAFINFSENPFFGRSMEDSDSDRNIVENSFLACLSNYGFVGFVFFINAFIYLLKIGIKSIRSIDIYSSISASIIIAIIIGGLFEGYLLSNLSLPTVSILLYSNFINHKLQFT
jgi:O-antigen ligase